MSLSIFLSIIALLIVLLALMYLSKVKFTLRMMVYIGLMLALCFILHQIRLMHMPQGGSVTCGSMLPLLLVSYRYGPSVGAFAGFLYSLINIIQDPFFMHPLQVLFDYPLPFMALGLAGLDKVHRYGCTLLAFAGRFLCHFISGAVFFGSYAPQGVSPYLYSLTFNASYLIPEFIICFLLLKLLPINNFLSRMDGSK